MKENICRKS